VALAAVTEPERTEEAYKNGLGREGTVLVVQQN